MSEVVKRQYDSTWRQEQARETRLRIIQAAHNLFVSKGYGSTTIADIARAAGVAVETVYAAFRNKHTVLRQVWYVSFRGDEEDIRLWDRPEIRAVIAEPDWPAGLGRKRPSIRRCLGVSPRCCSCCKARSPASRTQLRCWLSLTSFDWTLPRSTRGRRLPPASWRSARTSAATCLWATLDGALWHQLVAERGWSDERFAAWLGQLWISALVTV